MPRRTDSLLPAPPVYDTRARYVTFFSAALGIFKSFYIYIPPDLGAGQRAPTLYFLRGHEREWINPHEDATRAGTNVIDVYERLRAAGQVGPLLLVFPSMSSDDNRVPGLLVNMLAPQRAEATGIGSGRFDDYFFDDLLPYVEAQFPALAGRRGLAGFSLGGAMAIKAAAQRPDLFASASAYDGTFLYAADRGRRVRRTDSVIRNPIFDAAYDVPRNTRFIAANSPANLILRGDPAALGARHLDDRLRAGERRAVAFQLLSRRAPGAMPGGARHPERAAPRAAFPDWRSHLAHRRCLYGIGAAAARPSAPSDRSQDSMQYAALSSCLLPHSPTQSPAVSR